MAGLMIALCAAAVPHFYYQIDYWRESAVEARAAAQKMERMNASPWARDSEAAAREYDELADASTTQAAVMFVLGAFMIVVLISVLRSPIRDPA